MPKCPSCGEKINHVENVQEVIATYKLYKDGEYSKRPQYEEAGGNNTYQTPCCGEELGGEIESLELLNGKNKKGGK